MKRYSTHRTDNPRVTFWGAAQSVTGSMHLVEAAGRRILLDCGLVRGRRDEVQRNVRFPFSPADIDAVVLSHAHIDHCGNLPNLVRQGYSGPIYCTPATRDLTAVMLGDSARIQEGDAVVAGVVRGSAGASPGLYTRSDAHRVTEQCVAVPYETPHEVTPDIQLRFIDAGHILGSAMAELTVAWGGKVSRILFTGDLGRRGMPFLREPSAVPSADLLICESTYGGRVHEGLENMAGRMSEVVRRTLARGGKVLVPAFSLGRTQIVVHYLRRWMRDGVLPNMPLYVDSPLAADIADVYDRYGEFLPNDDGPGMPPVSYIRTAEDSKELCQSTEPCIVVASGGMCDGGRITTYLRQYIDDPRATIILVSYQAPQTLGRRLLEKGPTVRFHGRVWNKWAEVVEANGFSGHADRNDFLALLGASAGQTRQVRLVHGEPEQSSALARTLRERGFTDVAAPRLEDTAEVA